MASKPTLIVIGGGAAGFFCAINAAELNPEIEVVLLEKSNKFLSKVSISGGGRCNVTQASSSISEMIKAYPRGGRFLKKAFHQFFTNDIINWFDNRSVPLKAEADGRVFPQSDSSQTIIDCFLKYAHKAGIQLRLQSGVQLIKRYDNRFILHLSNSTQLTADYVCIACGGLPKMNQYDWLQPLDLKIIPPVPSLFTFNLPKNSISKLMGISIPEVDIHITGSKLSSSGPILITHWGLSGPAVLKLSSLAARELADKNYSFNIRINWLSEFNPESLKNFLDEYRKTHGVAKVWSKNPFGLPSRFWQYLLESTNVKQDKNWADLPAKIQNKLITNLCGQEFEVLGKTTFKEEFVTAGGISLDELDVNTMMIKKHPGLFVAGEIMDIDGITGGFNFQNAWTCGYIAAKSILNH